MPGLPPDWPTEQARLQLQALRRMLAFAHSEVLPRMRVAGDAMEYVLFPALFARGTSTCEAILLVSEHGYGGQAMMLNRALFELMVDAHWVHSDRDLAKESFVKHARLHAHLKRRAVRTYPDIFGEAEAEAAREGLPPEEVKALRRYRQSWTGLSLRDRVKAIEDQWTDPTTRRHMWFFLDVVNQLNNEELHPTSWSLGRILRRIPDTTGRERVQFRVGPEPELVHEALFNCFWVYGQLLGLVIEVFEMPLMPDLERLGEETAPVFRAVPGHPGGAPDSSG
jgi:hypothetical protein